VLHDRLARQPDRRVDPRLFRDGRAWARCALWAHSTRMSYRSQHVFGAPFFFTPLFFLFLLGQSDIFYRLPPKKETNRKTRKKTLFLYINHEIMNDFMKSFLFFPFFCGFV
jgi:hypothetical protein